MERPRPQLHSGHHSPPASTHDRDKVDRQTGGPTPEVLEGRPSHTTNALSGLERGTPRPPSQTGDASPAPFQPPEQWALRARAYELPPLLSAPVPPCTPRLPCSGSTRPAPMPPRPRAFARWTAPSAWQPRPRSVPPPPPPSAGTGSCTLRLPDFGTTPPSPAAAVPWSQPAQPSVASRSLRQLTEPPSRTHLP